MLIKKISILILEFILIGWFVCSDFIADARAEDEIKAVKALRILGETKVAYFGSSSKGEVKSFKNLSRDKIELANKTPFDIIALLFKADDLELADKYAEMLKGTQIEYWPRIIFPSNMIDKQSKRLDLWDKTKLDDAEKLLRASIKMAKLTSAEGIFMDPELYANHNNYWISFLSKLWGKSEEDIILRLRIFGGQIANTIQQESNGSPFTVWLTFADFHRELNDGFQRSTNYIIEGMLDTIALKKYSITVIEGGEVSIGYNHPNTKDLKKKIDRHKKNLASWVEKYAPHFKLAGTMVLYDNWASWKGWNNYLESQHKKGIENPVADSCDKTLSVLFNNYEYVWLYSGGKPMFDAFNANSQNLYLPVLENSLKKDNAKNLREDD